MLKISQLDALATGAIADDDFLEIVDVSDKKMGPGVVGSNKQVSVSALSNKFASDADSKFMPLYTNLPTNQIGDLSYLDLDIKGDYKGAQSTNYEKPYVLKERNGNFVGIRGGYNGIYRKQFYFTSPTDEFLASDVGLTDIEYRPKFLAATEYVSNLIDGNSDGFCVIVRNTVDTTKKFYWIRVNGTMDASKHTGIDITTLFTTSRGTGGSETFSNYYNEKLYMGASVVYCPEKQYWIATTRSSTEDIRFYVFNSAFTQLGTTFLQVNLQNDIDYGTLNGTDAYTFMYSDHTNRNNIQYDYDASTNVLTITNLATLVIVNKFVIVNTLVDNKLSDSCNLLCKWISWGIVQFSMYI